MKKRISAVVDRGGGAMSHRLRVQHFIKSPEPVFTVIMVR